MTKIATLSYQHAYNYGAVFQVSALQHVITQLGGECDIIDYRCPAIDNQYNLKPIRINSSFFSTIRSNLVLIPFIKQKKRNFHHWMESYQKTEPIESWEQLKSLNERYDIFVVGSDQVWNLKCQGYDNAFFLEFVDDNHKKVAYAASFGTYGVKNADKRIYSEYIGKFDSISVRESRGIELVKDFSGRDSIACMDPVLLAGRDYWKSKADYSELQQYDYIFVYQLGHDKMLPRFVKSMKKETRLKVIYVTGHIGNLIYYSIFDRNESSISPERFLALLSQAKYVVTNSFHASVLSILFQKQFYVISNGGAEAAYNSRIFNLLNDYNLEDRIKETYEDIYPIDDNRFSKIAEIHKKLSESSLLFLKSSLNL